MLQGLLVGGERVLKILTMGNPLGDYKNLIKT